MDRGKHADMAHDEAELADLAPGIGVVRAAPTARRAGALLDRAATAGQDALALFLGTLVVLWVAGWLAAMYLAALPLWPGWRDRAKAYAAARRAWDDRPDDGPYGPIADGAAPGEAWPATAPPAATATTPRGEPAQSWM